MEECLIYLVHLSAAGASACTVRPLPPLCMPQQLLPGDAVFRGVGRMDGQDVYLYATHAPAAQDDPAPAPFLAHLVRLATAFQVPQDFVLTRGAEGVHLTTRDLQEDLF